MEQTKDDDVKKAEGENETGQAELGNSNSEAKQNNGAINNPKDAKTESVGQNPESKDRPEAVTTPVKEGSELAPQTKSNNSTAPTSTTPGLHVAVAR